MKECNCYKILGLPKEKVHIHLHFCEQSYQVKEYDKLKWWKKIFTSNPRNDIKWFLKV